VHVNDHVGVHDHGSGFRKSSRHPWA
jgi:hypothetical protein